jgi:hypothetical protein
VGEVVGSRVKEGHGDGANLVDIEAGSDGGRRCLATSRIHGGVRWQRCNGPG